MLKENRILYSLDDVAIQPAGMSRVSSRFKCNPYINDRLPIFTAPMPCVVDFDTEQTYLDAHINPIIPRGHVKDIKNLNDRIRHSEFGFTAFSLSEFLNCFFYQDGKLDPDKKRYVLIDNANGNMK